MIQYLGHAIDEFPGPSNQTRCFAHTVNLIAKSILKPFEARKMKDIQEFNDVVQGLADTSKEDNIMEEDGEDEDDHEDEDEDKEGEDEGEDKFDMSLGPIKSMLLKVCLHFMTL
jgi:ABC-type Zn2+ transport system substrate-binding protein/surface adhesin